MKKLTLIPLLFISLFVSAQIQTINVSTPNSGTGENLRASMVKVNSNFEYLDSVAATKADSILIYNRVKLPLNSVFVCEGESTVSSAIVTSGSTTKGWQNVGYVSFANLLSGGRLFFPPTGMQASGGSTVSQIVARLDATLSLRPKVAIVCAGTNDLAGQTAEYISVYLERIKNAYLAVGSKVMLITILPRFGGQALSGPNETKRQTVNTTIKSWASNNVLVIDGDEFINSAIYYYDGLHPNTLGSYTLGVELAEVIDSIVDQATMSDILTPSNTASTNIYFAGTSGSLQNGASGTVPTGWYLDDSSIGATTVGSITSLNGVNSYTISITGNYSGTSKSVNMLATPSTYSIVTGDVIDGYVEYEIIANDANVICVSAQAAVWNSGFSDIAQAYSMLPFNQESNPLQTGVRYVSRTPSFQVGAGTPANYGIYIKTFLKTQLSSTPINFQVKIHRAGWIKVPSRPTNY